MGDVMETDDYTLGFIADCIVEIKTKHIKYLNASLEKIDHQIDLLEGIKSGAWAREFKEEARLTIKSTLSKLRMIKDDLIDDTNLKIILQDEIAKQDEMKRCRLVCELTEFLVEHENLNAGQKALYLADFLLDEALDMQWSESL